MWPLDPFTYLIEGLVSTVLQDVKVVCQPMEFHRFNPPSGQTCADWAGKFADAMGAYINNPNATSDCEYCQYRQGQDFFRGLSIVFEHRWRDVGIFIAVSTTPYPHLRTSLTCSTLRLTSSFSSSRLATCAGRSGKRHFKWWRQAFGPDSTEPELANLFHRVDS